MNDPNGLVYFDGEYHLFYQHNPHGNKWGHMSWGHAVSDDLVHWEHLPIALHEEYGVMIFSGCCVIDHKNSSGFGIDGKPPMVAIYTGHGHDLQTQDIAYSNDRGRTWTKYTGNPVLDIGMKDFRDPKVFWHEPTQRWVMVVSKAIDKILSFYGSKDLKSWEFLSDFGPAGIPGKPNWECPDLFELPIEGSTESKWVLEVDMGGGSVAGGSGGEYFVGEFDGKNFTCDHELTRSNWVDFGRDFYAPVSWSDVPKSDGRRIWIGWMNNWETHLLPTHPWRSAMSIPRVLSLRQTDKGYKLIQKPAAELKQLRLTEKSLSQIAVENRLDLIDHSISGARFEMVAEIAIAEASRCWLELRMGEEQSTIVGYDRESQELFVDRKRSGLVDFHPAFAGIHRGPMPLGEDGTIQLQIFVDESSIEVFGDGGLTTITDRIFPSSKNRTIVVMTEGGPATINSLQFWPLKSIWHQK